MYLANITHSDFDEMMRRSDLVKENGGNVCMLDVITLGFSAVATYRLKNTGQIIHAHRAMHGAITRQPGFTISMLVLAKVFRMLGVDLLHTGTAGAGKMEGGALETMLIVDDLEKDKTEPNVEGETLGQEWYGIKSVLAVASGGLFPGFRRLLKGWVKTLYVRWVEDVMDIRKELRLEHMQLYSQLKLQLKESTSTNTLKINLN